MWALAVRGELLYVAGQFDFVRRLPRPAVAALRLIDAKPTPFRAPGPRYPGYSRSPEVLVVTESSVIVNGADRSDPAGAKLAALDRRSGKRQRWSLKGPAHIDALLSYGNTLIAAHSHLPHANNLDKSLVVQYQTASGCKLRRIASSIGDGGEIATLDLAGSRLYIGGVFSRVNGTARRSLASFQLPSTRPLPWHPAGARSGFGVTLAIASTRSTVAVGVGSCRPDC